MSHEAEICPAPIASREELGDLLNRLGLIRVAVEIGTDKGVFAAELLQRWKGQLLICVDPWEDLPDYSGPLAGRPRFPDLLLCCATLAAFPGRVQLLQMRSDQAARHGQLEQVAGRIDFVYLDGNHAYSFVHSEIETFWPLLASGGILAGHDWEVPDVCRAVKEFAVSQRLPIFVMPGDAWSWYIQKPTT